MEVSTTINSPTLEQQFLHAMELMQSGRRDGAMLCLQNILISFPTCVEARNALGILFFERGDFDQAILNFERALVLRPSEKSIEANLVLAREQLSRAS